MARPIPQDYAFGNRDAEDVYEELTKDREQVIETARRHARISLPHEFPPEGYRPGDNLPPPNQGANGRYFTNLASRIALTALPPGMPILKYNVIEHKMKEALEEDPTLWSFTILALARREIAIRQRLEATNTRTAYTELDMQLLMAGNAMWRHISIDSPSVHKMTSYVVKRNAVGEQMLNILKQRVNLADLGMAERHFIENVRDNTNNDKSQTFGDEVDIYCCCKMHRVSDKVRVWLYWEEYKGEMIPDTDVQAPYDAPPQYAAWLKPNYGFNWGTSYATQYEGDMYIVENQNGSLNDGSEAAAITWIFVKPGGVTSKRVLEKAENLRIMHGDAADITVFRLEKNSDFQFVISVVERAERRLGQAFLMVSSIQRSGDRVTAEEWKQMSTELNMAMGGLYSAFAQGAGKHIITRFSALAEQEDKMLVELPKGVVRISPITGMDAMAMDEEEVNLERAIEVAGRLLGPEAVGSKMDIDEALRRILAGNRVRPDGLLLSMQTQQANTQQAEQKATAATVLDKAAGPIAKEGAAALSQAMTPEMMQQMMSQATGQ